MYYGELYMYPTKNYKKQNKCIICFRLINKTKNNRLYHSFIIIWVDNVILHGDIERFLKHRRNSLISDSFIILLSEKGCS